MSAPSSVPSRADQEFTVSNVAVKALNHVAIGVTDLEASLRFYTEGLGMRKTLEKPVSDLAWMLLRLPEGTTGTSVFVQGDQKAGQIELVTWDLPESVPGHKRPGDIGAFQLSFPVDPEHIRPLHDRLVSMGYEVYQEPFESIVKNYGPVVMFICEDPDGNQVEFIALPSPETVKTFRADPANKS